MVGVVLLYSLSIPWWKGELRSEAGTSSASPNAILVVGIVVSEQALTRERIVEALNRLDAHLADAGKKATIYVVGGAVMCLVLEARESTKDVDAWFSEPDVVRQAATRVAEELSLPSAWLNDAVKAFLPANAGFERWATLPHLDILVADDATMFAMKVAAARTQEDADDLRVLARRLGVDSSRAALDIALRYYPEERLSVRSRLLLEEILDDGD